MVTLSNLLCSASSVRPLRPLEGRDYFGAGESHNRSVEFSLGNTLYVVFSTSILSTCSSMR
jgi:hypothetical protein